MRGRKERGQLEANDWVVRREVERSGESAVAVQEQAIGES